MERPSAAIIWLLLLVLALGALGMAQALWSETLNINGNVSTGYLEAKWNSPVGCYDFEDKNVGSTNAWVDGNNDNLLHFQITNGYPSYTGGCEVGYTYVGTIPVHVEAINFIPGNSLTNCVVNQSPNTGSFTATCDQLKIDWSDGLCSQLHQGDHQSSSLKVHVEQGAAQSSSYGFQVQVQLNQYNESNCP